MKMKFKKIIFKNTKITKVRRKILLTDSRGSIDQTQNQKYPLQQFKTTNNSNKNQLKTNKKHSLLDFDFSSRKNIINTEIFLLSTIKSPIKTQFNWIQISLKIEPNHTRTESTTQQLSTRARVATWRSKNSNFTATGGFYKNKNPLSNNKNDISINRK